MPNKSPIKEVSWFGKNCSLYLYLIHFMVVVLIASISPDENTWVEAWLNPLIVLMISILISILIYIIVYLIKNRRRKENEIQNI